MKRDSSKKTAVGLAGSTWYVWGRRLSWRGRPQRRPRPKTERIRSGRHPEGFGPVLCHRGQISAQRGVSGGKLRDPGRQREIQRILQRICFQCHAGYHGEPGGGTVRTEAVLNETNQRKRARRSTCCLPCSCSSYSCCAPCLRSYRRPGV